jgi:hypothetical protein
MIAVLDYHRFPVYNNAGLVAYRVLACLPDRLIIEPGGGMPGYLLVNLRASGMFRPAVLDRKLHGPTAVWTMRECVPFGSMQITGHQSLPKILYDDGTLPSSSHITNRDKEEVFSWELDIDHGNPSYLSSPSGHRGLVSLLKGVGALIAHGCEVAYPGKTNPWWIRRRLLSRGIQVPLVASPGEV